MLRLEKYYEIHILSSLMQTGNDNTGIPSDQFEKININR